MAVSNTASILFSVRLVDFTETLWSSFAETPYEHVCQEQDKNTSKLIHTNRNLYTRKKERLTYIHTDILVLPAAYVDYEGCISSKYISYTGAHSSLDHAGIWLC